MIYPVFWVYLLGLVYEGLEDLALGLLLMVLDDHCVGVLVIRVLDVYVGFFGLENWSWAGC